MSLISRVWAVVTLIVLAGCTSLPQDNAKVSPLGTADKPTASVPVGPNVTDTEQVQLFYKQLAANLKQKPNLYIENRSGVAELARTRFQQATRLNQQGKKDAAREQFSSLTQDFPGLSGPWVQLGDLAEDKETAVRHYQQAVSINPNNYFAHNRLARSLRLQGEFLAAREHYLKAQASWPAYAKAYLNLGILLDLYLGQKAEALAQYRIYMALIDGQDKQVESWITDLSRQLARQQADAANAQPSGMNP